MTYEEWLVAAVVIARKRAVAENDEWETGQYQGLEWALDKYREIELGVTE
jgi:hypothetical protein